MTRRPIIRCCRRSGLANQVWTSGKDELVIRALAFACFFFDATKIINVFFQTGRVADGTCYRLIPKEFFNLLPAFPEPSINRQPLEKIVLDVKRLNRGASPKETLGFAITPPRLDDIEITILKLKEVGALSLYKNSEFCVADGDLTYAGEIMAQLPIDINLAKLVVFGLVFGKLREAIVIAAGLSVKSIFNQIYHADLESYKGKFAWSDGLFCDFNAIVNAYNVWEYKTKKKPFATAKQKYQFMYESQLQIKQLREVSALVVKTSIIFR